MNPALTQLQDLAKLGLAQVATKQELEVFLKAVLQILKETQSKNDSNASLLIARFQSIKADLDRKQQIIDNALSSVTELVKETESKVALVPDMPTIVANLEQKIAGIPPPKEPIPETPQQIRDKLEILKGADRLDKSAIRGLDEELKRIEEIRVSVRREGGGAGGLMRGATQYYKLTPDGSTKVFSVPQSTTAIVFMSDFPHILWENNGFTLNGGRTQMTLTVDNAPSTGSQLVYSYSPIFGS